MHPLVSRSLEIALGQVGVRELRGNRGAAVEGYLAAVGLAPGNPWCAAFIYWAVDRAAREHSVANPYLRTGSCALTDSWARDHDILMREPAAGDAFLLYGPSRGGYRAHHTGLVASVDAYRRRIATVEGNTNLDGSPEGIGVFRRDRGISASLFFVRWEPLIPAAEVPFYTLTYRDKPLWAMPIVANRALCPVRKLAEWLGLTVEWDGEGQRVILGGRPLAVTLSFVAGAAMAPVRELAGALGLVLDVDPAARRVEIDRPETPP